MSIELKSQHHLFRYASEWDPREKGKTKGGYLEGSIGLPPCDEGVRVVISTYPAQLPEGLEDACKDIHPTLLHLVRKTRARRMQELEPVPNIHHWRQELVIKGKTVSIINKTSAADKGRNIPPTDQLFSLKDENVLPFGKEAGELNLIILIPKSDARAQGDDVTLNNLLSNRITDKAILGRMDENFKGKKSVNLKQVKLKVEFYKVNDDSLICSAISQTISDTASKQLGALDFHDATPLKSCEKGGRKVIMVAEFGLATDVEPRFQLWDRQGNRLRDREGELLKQPVLSAETVALFKESIIFITPDQPNLKIILDNGFKITLGGRRKSDGWESRKKFPFYYNEHITNCFYCFLSPDGGESCQQGQAKLPQKKEGPRPGRKKRKMSETDEGDVEMVPVGRQDSTAASSRDSTESQITLSPLSDDSGAVVGVHEITESADTTHHSQPKPGVCSCSSFTFPLPQTQASIGINEIGKFGARPDSGVQPPFRAEQTYAGDQTFAAEQKFGAEQTFKASQIFGGRQTTRPVVITHTDQARANHQSNITMQWDQIGATSESTANTPGEIFHFICPEGSIMYHDNRFVEAERHSVTTEAPVQVLQNFLTNDHELWNISTMESPPGTIANSDLSILSPQNPTPSPPHSIEYHLTSQTSMHLGSTDLFTANDARQTNMYDNKLSRNTDGANLTVQTVPKDISWILGNPNLSLQCSSVEDLQNTNPLQQAYIDPLPFEVLEDIVEDGSCLQDKGTSVSDLAKKQIHRVSLRRDRSTQEDDIAQEENEEENEEEPGLCERLLQKLQTLPLYFIFLFILAKWYFGNSLPFFEGVFTTLIACIMIIFVKDLIFRQIG